MIQSREYIKSEVFYSQAKTLSNSITYLGECFLELCSLLFFFQKISSTVCKSTWIRSFPLSKYFLISISPGTVRPITSVRFLALMNRYM